LRTLLNIIWLILSGIQAIADRLNADRVPTAQGGQEWGSVNREGCSHPSLGTLSAPSLVASRVLCGWLSALRTLPDN
jgi:hypothetical protein